MGRAPCCDKSKVKRGPWSPEEDTTLRNYVHKHGTAAGSWIALPQKAGLKRCGKSCRLRWLNYLRPNIKHGGFTQQEDTLILSLYHTIGSRWSVIASQLPGRTDNDVKNYWNTKLKKRLFTPGPTNSSYNPASVSASASASASATSSFITSTNTINSESDNMLPYFPLDDVIDDSYQQIPLPALVEAPENDFALLPSAPVTLSPPFSADNNIHANGSRNGSCQDDDAFLFEFGCGLMPYDIINAFDFHEKFNQEIYNNLGFGSNVEQEQQAIYQNFTY